MYGEQILSFIEHQFTTFFGYVYDASHGILKMCTRLKKLCILCCITSIMMCVSTFFVFRFAHPMSNECIQFMIFIHGEHVLYATTEEAKWHNQNSTLNSMKNQVYAREREGVTTIKHIHPTYALPPKRFCMYIATSQKPLAAKAIIFTHQFILLVYVLTGFIYLLHTFCLQLFAG